MFAIEIDFVIIVAFLFVCNSIIAKTSRFSQLTFLSVSLQSSALDNDSTTGRKCCNFIFIFIQPLPHMLHWSTRLDGTNRDFLNLSTYRAKKRENCIKVSFRKLMVNVAEINESILYVRILGKEREIEWNIVYAMLHGEDCRKWLLLAMEKRKKEIYENSILFSPHRNMFHILTYSEQELNNQRQENW